MIIRAMQGPDLPAVLALTRAVQEAPQWSETHIRQLIGEDESGRLLRRAWVATYLAQPDQVRGFIVLQALRLPAGGAVPEWECEVESIVVDGGFRRQGIGSQLLCTALAWCRERDVANVRLEVRSQNKAAIHLYQQAGFITTGHRAGYYQFPTDDAVLMELEVGAI